jgi:hypothetical protein
MLVEAGKALWPIIQDAMLGRTEAILRAVAAEDMALSCAPRIAKATAPPPVPGAPATPKPTPANP